MKTNNIRTYSIKDLIDKSKQNDSRAQSLLMEYFWSEIKNYTVTIVKEDSDAEDVTVETFTKVFDKLHLYNSDFDFKNWVISIAHNTSIDFLRKKHRFISNLQDSELERYIENVPSIEDIIIEKQKEVSLEDIIADLDEKYRKILHQKYIDGMSIKEIAQDSNLSISNVKVRLMRARKLLNLKN
ncbi:MAG: RNA polymerase sigma factor [Flavobacteriales bacterium]|nr:RNA polymerase sigma factor [Flavobacteriales bacterium]